MLRSGTLALALLFAALTAARSEDEKKKPEPAPAPKTAKATDDKPKTTDKAKGEKKSADKTPEKKSAEKKADDKAAYTLHEGQFEKNTSGLSGPVSVLVFTSREAFDKVFGVAFVMGKRPNVVPKDAFDSKLAVAVVHRGNALWNYEVEKVAAEGGTLTVRYRAGPGMRTGATFASPLILTVDKDKVKRVVFVENGRQVGTADVKGRQD